MTAEWFWDWASDHQIRFPRADWPALDTVFWETLMAVFEEKGVTPRIAEAASVRMFADSPAYLDAHPKAILERVRQIQAEDIARRERKDRISPAPRPEDASFERDVNEHWSGLAEEDREYWVRLVRERAPELARHLSWLTRLAKGWAYDPSLVIEPAPPVDPRPKHGPRRVFQ